MFFPPTSTIQTAFHYYILPRSTQGKFSCCVSQGAEVHFTVCKDMRNDCMDDGRLNDARKIRIKKKRERKKKEAALSPLDFLSGFKTACLPLPKLLTVRGLVGNNAIFNL